MREGPAAIGILFFAFLFFTNAATLTACATPSQLKVATNRLTVLDDPMMDVGNVGGCVNNSDIPWGTDYWNNDHTMIQAYALVLNESGRPEAGVTVTFELRNKTGSLVNTATDVTDGSGIANYSSQMNNRGINSNGTYTITASIASPSLSSAAGFNYTAMGCKYCHGNPGTVIYDAWTADTTPRSPYSRTNQSGVGYGMINLHVNRLVNFHSNNMEGNQCVYCHRDYGYPVRNVLTDNTPPTATWMFSWGVHSNATGSGVNCWNCHERANGTASAGTGPAANVPSCFNSSSGGVGCHGGTGARNTNVTPFSTYALVGGRNTSRYSDTYPASSSPLKAHNATDNVPCVLCHGPAHNETKPGLTPAQAESATYSNRWTEDLHCTTCHKTQERHNSTVSAGFGVNCTVCHSQDVHKIRYFSNNSTGPAYINTSTTRGNCMSCHQNATYFSDLLKLERNATVPRSGNYTGLRGGAPQIPAPLNHSDDSLMGKKWNLTSSGFWNTTFPYPVGNRTLNACYFCHNKTYMNSTPLGRPLQWMGSNARNSSLEAGNWCSGCHNRFYRNGSGTYQQMTGAFNASGLEVPPEHANDSRIGTYARDGATEFFKHNLANASDATCASCHGQNISGNRSVEFVHRVSVGQRCEDCHFNWTKMDATYNRPTKWLNGTMFNGSVHGTSDRFPNKLYCFNCHTVLANATAIHPGTNPSLFTPPESGWKWCESCHVRQSDPVSQTDRHNITRTPSATTIGGLPSVAVSDCRTCHDSSRLANATATFNRTSGKDCRFCHTLPDRGYQ